MVLVIESGATAHAPAVLSGLVGAGLIAAATVAGAWLARRSSGHREIWLAAAAAALLVIAGLHLLPDAWGGAGAVRIWAPLVPMAAIGAFTVAGLAARAGCGCREHAAQASGAGAAAALALHRFLRAPPSHSPARQRSRLHWPFTRWRRPGRGGTARRPATYAWRAGWRP